MRLSYRPLGRCLGNTVYLAAGNRNEQWYYSQDKLYHPFGVSNPLCG